jgi:hypothetical protein
VISLIQSNNFYQESFIVLSTQSNITSKPQISRQLLKSLVTETEANMPLAQNYKDDVSLLESEAALSKTTMNCMNTDFVANQEINTKPNVSECLYFILEFYRDINKESLYFTKCDIMLLLFLQFLKVVLLFDEIYIYMTIKGGFFNNNYL